MTFSNKGRGILTTVLIIGIVSLMGCGTTAQNTVGSYSTTPSMGTISESKELTKADMKVDKLSIGQILASVQQDYGKPTKTSIIHGNGAPQWEYTDRGFTVGGDPVFSIVVSSKYLGCTSRGIQIGSKEQDVRQAYPNIRWVQDNTQLFDESKDKKYSIDFFISKGIVSKIIVTDENPED